MSKTKYFITGTPRSGTAWLSNFLTWGGSFCYHEGMYDVDNIDGYRDRLDSTPADFVGDANTQLVVMLPWLYQMYPDAKYIFLYRDMDEVKHSLISNGFSTHMMDEIERCMQWGMNNIPSMSIDYEDMFYDVKSIWDYIGLPDFPSDRHHLLHDIRVDDTWRFKAMTENNVSSLIAEMQGVH